MRLSNYYKCFFRQVFLNIVLVREAVSVRKKISESRRLPVLSRAFNTYIRVYMGKGGVQTLAMS